MRLQNDKSTCFLLVSLATVYLGTVVCRAEPDPEPQPEPLPDPHPYAWAEPGLGAGADKPLLHALVRRLPTEVDGKREILISYLTAVSTLSNDINQFLTNISSSNSAPTSSKDHDTFTRKLNQIANCLSTDFYGSTISGALVVAIDEINNNPKLLPNHTLKYIWGNTCGNDTQSTRMFMEHWQAGARLFIGPEKTCKTEASMASAQNLPIISYRCNDQEVSRNDYHYRTFARTVPPAGEIFKAFLSLCRNYGWRKFSVVYEVKKGHTRNEMFETLKKVIEEENAFLEHKFELMNSSLVEFSEVKGAGSIEEAIRSTKDNTRIYLAFNNVRLFRKILATLGDMGLTKLGYVLVYLDTSYDWHNVYHAMNNHFLRNTMISLNQSWDHDDSDDRKMIEYSKSAVAIIPTPVKLNSQRFYNFWKKANEYLHYFGVQKSGVLEVDIKANRIACYLYDAVYLYANAIHEMLEENDGDRRYDPTADGKAIMDRIINKKYTSIQGFDMRIDEKGNAKGNFTLLTWMNVTPITDKADPKYYPNEYALDLTATFVESADKGDRLPVLKYQYRQINWDTPPVDEPPCGFTGSRCGSKSEYITVLFMTIFFVLIVSSSVIAGFTYRNRRYEKELSMIWRIDPSEVHRIGKTESTVSLLQNEMNSHSGWLTASSQCKGSGLREVGYYKGTLVALKEMMYHRKPRELTRDAKKELRVMRQLAHPNLNTFMGIVMCPMSICIVREFCAKGSLLDVLRNKDLKLDHLYIASFVEDLVKGMIYLHDSEVKVHGNLKSTNCLITSRWTLQIADFGLYEIKEGMLYEDSESMWENFLWTAPELLYITELHVRKAQPTQDADVYSFGIILHEIMTREGPFRLCELPEFTPEEIVRRVSRDANFRPSLVGLDLQNYITDTINLCWAEEPDQRPEFKNVIKNRLKPMFSQIYKRNIMDHMILMMEKYQTQLEDLVEDRTAELRDEQRRSQNLLQRMLPRQVADQLLSGNDVIPEAFPSVTVFFSDIVGFTTIAGSSTPMEVVNFLNKLYTLFDSIIRRYQVYKVETIGDAYMVVSGLPIYTTEVFHAEQIATMALHLLSCSKNFQIPHLPTQKLQMRIGLHTGPCVAGVVGKTMPRYTLFGDTVNTASRMESNGHAYRIHCSESTKNVLSAMPEFKFELRETMPIKGKGNMTTYWLLSREGFDFAETSDTTQKISDAAEIFPRQKLKVERGSTWGVNARDRESTLSLTGKDQGHLRKRTERPRNSSVKDFVSYSHANGGMVNIGPGREMPKVKEEDGSTPLLFAKEPRKRKPLRNAPFPSGRKFYTSAITCNRGGDQFNEQNSVALRKRSTSLPDGEGLNLEFLRGGQSPAPSTSTAYSPAFRRMSFRQSATTIPSITTPSESQYLYPSNGDLFSDQKRKRGMATVYPLRKRSLSVGDSLQVTFMSSPMAASAISQLAVISRRDLQATPTDSAPEEDDSAALIGDPEEFFEGHAQSVKSTPKGRRPFLRETTLAKRIRDASPFGNGKKFWSTGQPREPRSRGESLTRMWRRIRDGRGSEYEDLQDDEDVIEMKSIHNQESLSNTPLDSQSDGSEPLLVDEDLPTPIGPQKGSFVV